MSQGGGDAAGSVAEMSPRPSRMMVREPANWSKRLWNWVLGNDVPMLTIEQAEQYARTRAEEIVGQMKAADPLFAEKRFSITKAVNGHIVRYSGPDTNNENEALSASRLERMRVERERYYVVKDGESVLDAVATLAAIDRVAG